MSTDPNAFLMGGGGRSAKFETAGDTITGTITGEPEIRQQTDIKTSQPKFWDNGDPQMQLVVRLQTALREDADDDGIRAIYVKGGFKAPTMQKAVADAVRASGAKGLAVGGTLTVTYTGNGPASGVGMSPPKYYTAQYQPPVVGAAFLQEPAAPAAVPQQAPAYTPPPAPPVPAAGHPAPATAPNGEPMVTLPDGSVVTAAVAALIGQVQPPAA
jgi:hypothetical protein